MHTFVGEDQITLLESLNSPLFGRKSSDEFRRIQTKASSVASNLINYSQCGICFSVVTAEKEPRQCDIC